MNNGVFEKAFPGFDRNKMGGFSEDSFVGVIIDKINDASTKYVSFDFFDTLVFRSVPVPGDVFILLFRELVNRNIIELPISEDRFKDIRMQAEAKARQLSGSFEVNLSDIYAQFPVGFFNADLADVINIELEVERKVIGLNPIAFYIFDYAIEKGKKVIVVSDTYFSSRDLYDFLGENSRYFPIEDIYVSNRYGTHKAHNLFSLVLQRLMVSPHEVVHVGDNYISDVETPAKLGIRSVLLPNGTGGLWNSILEENKLLPDFGLAKLGDFGDMGLTSLRCKAAPLTALEAPDSYYLYGVESIGPVLAFYCKWVDDVCRTLGVSRKISLMREGFLISKVVAMLSGYEEPEEDDVGYVSRRLVIQGAITEINEAELNSLLIGRGYPTVSEYLSFLGLQLADIPSFSGYGYHSLRDGKLSAKVINEILSSDALVEKILRKSSEIRHGLINHFMPKMKLDDYDGEKSPMVALLDLGWNGTIQKYLQRIFDFEGIEVRFVGMYLMTTPSVNQLILDGVQAYGFCVDAGNPVKDFNWLSRTLEILEQSCSPSFGSTIGYKKNGLPILGASLIRPAQHKQIERIQLGVLQSVNLFKMKGLTKFKPGSVEASRIRAILLRAMVMPTKNEVGLFRDWHHDENLMAQSSECIVGDQYLDFVRYMTPKQLIDLPMSDVYWPFALGVSGATHVVAPIRSAILANTGGIEGQSGVFDSSVVIIDVGRGFSDGIAKSQDYCRNVYGLFYQFFAFGECSPCSIRVIPCSRDSILRIDKIRIRWMDISQGQETEIEIFQDRLESLCKTSGMKPIGQGLFKVGANGTIDISSIFNSAKILSYVKIEFAGEAMRGSGNSDADWLCDKTIGVLSSSLGDQSSLPVRKGGKACFDEINGIPYNPKKSKDVYVQPGGDLQIRGWAFDSIRKLAGFDVYLRLSLGDNCFYIRCERTLRPDVATVFGVDGLAEAGFLVRCNISDLKVGVYDVGVSVVVDGGVVECNSLCVLHVGMRKGSEGNSLLKRISKGFINNM